MSKNILIVESDSAQSRNMRGKLESAGFTVEETTDGKGSPELIRRQHPDLVLLAVDLAAGQNGYIICGKLKKDDELKRTPVVIIGNPDGFAQHRKLKTRADEYLAKPVDLDGLLNAVGGLIGLPEPPAEVVEDNLGLGDLMDGGPTGEFQAGESPEEVRGDAELDMLDSAFDDISEVPPAAVEEVEISGLNEMDSMDDEDQKTVVGFVPGDLNLDAAPPPLPTESKQPMPARGAPVAAVGTGADVRELRAQVVQLNGSLDDARSRNAELENRISELEAELSSKTGELEAARSSGGKHDKEFFALREQITKKDKEILKLKTEANQKDSELVERQERIDQLDQQVTEANDELARRDGQIKTLTAKGEQLAAERKRLDQQLASTKEEARAASALNATLQSDLDQANDRIRSTESELEEVKGFRADLESTLEQERARSAELQRDLESTREQLDSTQRQLEETRSQLDSTQHDLESTKNTLMAQATAFAEEAASLRRRIAELEETGRKNEERIGKMYNRIKEDDKLREKTKKALSIALQLLEEQASADDVEVAA